jgi:hypothetical protein
MRDAGRIVQIRSGVRVCAPGMGAPLPVRVRSKGRQETGDHPDRSEPQLQKGDRLWGGRGQRNRGPMDKNPIRSDAEQGERAMDREALDGRELRWRKLGGRAVTGRVLTWGDSP